MARVLRSLGAAGFTYKGCEVTFFEPLPVEMQEVKQRVEGFEETEETPQERLARLRRRQLDADIHGSA